MTRIKLSKTKAYDIELIQFEKKGPLFLNVRQMYATQKDSTFRPGRQGLTLALEEDDKGRTEARRVLKAMVKVLKNEDGEKPRLLPKKEK